MLFTKTIYPRVYIKSKMDVETRLSYNYNYCIIYLFPLSFIYHFIRMICPTSQHFPYHITQFDSPIVIQKEKVVEKTLTYI